MTIDDFLIATASDAPVPGGGSVSALCGAMGAALATMVCRLTCGRKRYAEAEPQVRAILEAVEPEIDILRRAVDLDAQAYARVMEAYKLPKDTDEQRAARADAITLASMEAAMVPLGVAERAAGVMELAAPLARIGNVNARTDVGVAMLCLRTAAQGAVLNALVNLRPEGTAEADDAVRARCREVEQRIAATFSDTFTPLRDTL